MQNTENVSDVDEETTDWKLWIAALVLFLSDQNAIKFGGEDHISQETACFFLRKNKTKIHRISIMFHRQSACSHQDRRERVKDAFAIDHEE